MEPSSQVLTSRSCCKTIWDTGCVLHDYSISTMGFAVSCKETTIIATWCTELTDQLQSQSETFLNLLRWSATRFLQKESYVRTCSQCWLSLVSGNQTGLPIVQVCNYSHNNGGKRLSEKNLSRFEGCSPVSTVAWLWILAWALSGWFVLCSPHVCMSFLKSTLNWISAICHVNTDFLLKKYI